ncbi:MAG: hypothetical protein K2X81_19910 [Candidatus Obscuribacterales bacterium]|nr:hypothetical protein [Candidatus Obscuribacterales bacterium]
MGVSPKDPPPPSSRQTNSVSVRKSTWLDPSLKNTPSEIERLKNVITQDTKSVLVPFFGASVLCGMSIMLVCLAVVVAMPVFHSLVAIPAVLALTLFAGLAGGIHTFVNGPNRLSYFRIRQHTIQMRMLELQLYEAQICNGNDDDKRDAWQRLVAASDEVQKLIAIVGKQTIASQKIKNLTNGEQTLIANASKVANQAEQRIRTMLKELDPDLSNHPALAYGEALSQANTLQATDIHTDRLLEQ